MDDYEIRVPDLDELSEEDKRQRRLAGLSFTLPRHIAEGLGLQPEDNS
jgi:hypothetical protein